MHPFFAGIGIAVFCAGLMWIEAGKRDATERQCAILNAVAITTPDGVACARIDIVGRP